MSTAVIVVITIVAAFTIVQVLRMIFEHREAMARIKYWGNSSAPTTDATGDTTTGDDIHHVP
jgi:hypothetical protein